MTLEQVVGVAVLGLANWKLLRDSGFFNEEMSKTILDGGNFLIVFAGVLLSFTNILTWQYLALLTFFEAFYIVFALIYDKIKQLKKVMLNYNKIDPLDI